MLNVDYRLKEFENGMRNIILGSKREEVFA
jgi:hypothetical protein